MEIPSDLLIISSHADKTIPVSGQFIYALKRRGIEVDSDNYFQTIIKSKIWTCFQDIKGDLSIKHLLMVRMEKCEELQYSVDYFDKAIKGIFASISSLEYLGYSFKIINFYN